MASSDSASLFLDQVISLSPSHTHTHTLTHTNTFTHMLWLPIQKVESEQGITYITCE